MKNSNSILMYSDSASNGYRPILSSHEVYSGSHGLNKEIPGYTCTSLNRNA